MKRLWIAPVLLAALFAGGAVRIVQDQCGPFTDVTPSFCPFVSELYYLGITAGTSPTTFSPDDPLTRGQAAVFIAKGLNQSLARSSRRAALGQWWAPSFFPWVVGLGVTPLPEGLGPLVCDGFDVWVGGNSHIFRVRASDGKLLDTWTIANPPSAILAAMGRVFIAGGASLYMIDPASPSGGATQIAALPSFTAGLAFDGNRLWTANQGGSVSIIDPSPTTPWPVTTVRSGFQAPFGIVFDGQHNWVSDTGSCTLLELDSSAAVLRTVNFGMPDCAIYAPIFDGSNVLLPNGNALQVVRASDGSLVATVPITTNAAQVAFDGERILVQSSGGGQNTPRGLTLLRAADFSTLRIEGFLPIGGPGIAGIAADGVNFWVTFQTGNGDVLARY